MIDLVNLKRANSTWQGIVKQARFQKKIFFTTKVPEKVDRSGPFHWNPVLVLAGAELEGENCYVLCKELYGRFLVEGNTPKERRQLRNGSWQQIAHHTTAKQGTFRFDMRRKKRSSTKCICSYFRQS